MCRGGGEECQHPCRAGCGPSSRQGHEVHRKTECCLQGESRAPSPPRGWFYRQGFQPQASRRAAHKDHHACARLAEHARIAVPLLLSPFPGRNPLFFWTTTLLRVSLGEKGENREHYYSACYRGQTPLTSYHKYLS